MISTTPNKGDTEQILWQRICRSLNVLNANKSAYDPKNTDSVRQLLVKILKTLN